LDKTPIQSKSYNNNVFRKDRTESSLNHVPFQFEFARTLTFKMLLKGRTLLPHVTLLHTDGVFTTLRKAFQYL